MGGLCCVELPGAATGHRHALVFVVGDVRELWPFLVALVVSLYYSYKRVSAFRPSSEAASTRGVESTLFKRHSSSPSCRWNEPYNDAALFERFQKAGGGQSPPAWPPHVAHRLRATMPRPCHHAHAHAHALWPLKGPASSHGFIPRLSPQPCPCFLIF